MGVQEILVERKDTEGERKEGMGGGEEERVEVRKTQGRLQGSEGEGRGKGREQGDCCWMLSSHPFHLSPVPEQNHKERENLKGGIFLEIAHIQLKLI